MDEKVTISDIAREVGVSKTTISRYLNGSYGYMSDKTRRRIEQVIEQTGYVPNNVARTLRSKKSNLIGVVVNTLRYQVGAQTVTGIQDVCNKYGYGTVVCCSDDDPDKELEAIQLCQNQQVDGFIIIPCLEKSDRYIELCQRGTPVVLCTRRLTDWPYGCVYVKHEEMIGQMMVHLKEQGFEKVQFLLDVNNFHKRRMGDAFAQRAKELFDMEPDESIALVGRKDPKIPEALDQFKAKWVGTRKAVMAVNTHTLFLTLQELERRGCHIPEDIGVCGYDAQGWAELVPPGISAIRQPMDQMGIQAAEELMAALAENRMSQNHVALSGKVFFRDSTKRN